MFLISTGKCLYKLGYRVTPLLYIAVNHFPAWNGYYIERINENLCMYYIQREVVSYEFYLRFRRSIIEKQKYFLENSKKKFSLLKEI